jgi:hypothetical protein
MRVAHDGWGVRSEVGAKSMGGAGFVLVPKSGESSPAYPTPRFKALKACRQNHAFKSGRAKARVHSTDEH